MEHPNAALVRELYKARAEKDHEAVRAVLSEDVVWHEPEVGGEHSGDLYGPGAVLEMLQQAAERTDGTFHLVPRGSRAGSSPTASPRSR